MCNKFAGEQQMWKLKTIEYAPQQYFHLKAAFFQGKTVKKMSEFKEKYWKNYQNYMDK